LRFGCCCCCCSCVLGFFFSLLVVGGGATVDLAGARCFFFFLVEVWEGATASSVSVWSPSSWQLSEPLADSSPVEKNDEEHAHPLASLSWSNTTATTTNKQQQRLTYLMIDFLNLEIMRHKSVSNCNRYCTETCTLSCKTSIFVAVR